MAEQIEMEEFGRRMNGKEYENMSEMNSMIMMTKEVCEIVEEQDNSQEDRGWMTDDIRTSNDGRKERNRK